MPKFVAVMHVTLSAPDEVSAVIEAEKVRESLEKDEIISVEDGESADMVQVIPLAEDPTPSANILQLKRARNILIRTRFRDCFDVAQELDKMAHALSVRLSPQESQVSYDYGKFMEVAADVLRGDNPL